MSEHLVSVNDFGILTEPKTKSDSFYHSLPNILAGKELRGLAQAIVRAKTEEAPIVFAIGGHVVKVGCSPYLTDLARQGFITAVVMNGAAAIHDAELVQTGETSQDVESAILAKDFGSKDTADLFIEAANSHCLGLGLQEALFEANKFKGARSLSILAMKELPKHVILSVGADTIWNFNLPRVVFKAAANEYDCVCDLTDSMSGKAAVWVNIGSAQLLPEVFLKASANSIRGGRDLTKITKANMDMVRSYRPYMNVLKRIPGTNYELTGHHEIMIPLLRLAILCEAEKTEKENAPDYPLSSIPLGPVGPTFTEHSKDCRWPFESCLCESRSQQWALTV